VTVKLVLTIGLWLPQQSACCGRAEPGRSSGAVGAHAELPTTGIGPTGIAVTLAPSGALLVLDTTVTLAVFKPWGQTRFQRH
jgi:hypothetical protein